MRVAGDRQRLAFFLPMALLAACCAWPEESTTVTGGDGTLEISVTPIPEGAVDPSVFEPPSGDASADLLEFVRLGYGDLHDRDVRSLEFRTEELTTDQTIEVLGLVDSYNAFEGPKVAGAVESFRGRVAGWAFGREGSPALYVRLPYWTNQLEGPTLPREEATQISDEDHQRLVEELQATFTNQCHADEFDAMPYSRDHEFRIWWD